MTKPNNKLMHKSKLFKTVALGLFSLLLFSGILSYVYLTGMAASCYSSGDIVQECFAKNAGGTSVTVTLDNATTAGNLLIVYGEIYGSGSHFVSVSNGGTTETFTHLGGGAIGSGGAAYVNGSPTNNQQIDLVYTTNATGGLTSVTVTNDNGGPTSQAAVSVIEVKNCSGCTYDIAAAATASSSSSPSVPSMTIASSNKIVYTMFAPGSVANINSVGSPFTIIDTANTFRSSTATAYDLAATAGTSSPTWSLSASDISLGSAISFKTSGASQSFIQQPGNIASGNAFSPAVSVQLSPAAGDSMTLSINGCGATLTGTLTVTASGGGLATWTGVGATGAASGCILTSHDNTNGGVADIHSNAFTVATAPVFQGVSPAFHCTTSDCPETVTIPSAGTDRTSFVRVSYGNGVNQSVASIKIGGQHLTPCGPVAYNENLTVGSIGSYNKYGEIWALGNPPTGSQVVDVGAWGDLSAITDIHFDVVTFSGVYQGLACPVALNSWTTAIGSGGTLGLTIPTDVTKATITVTNSGTATVTSTNQTQDNIDNTGTDHFGSDHQVGASGTVTHTWTYSASVPHSAAGMAIISDTPLSTNNVYLDNSGSGTGAACGNALIYTYFNNVANWSASPSGFQIGPGTTVHLCGTITVAGGNVGLTAQGDGLPENPVTIKFETGSILQSTNFNPRAININGHNAITIDGNSTGTLQNTNNGTTGYSGAHGQPGCITNPCNAYGTDADMIGTSALANYITVKNLTIKGCYVRMQNATVMQDGGIPFYGGEGINLDGNYNQALNNTISDCAISIGALGFYPVISHNTNTNYNRSIIVGPTAGKFFNCGSIDHNNISTAWMWDDDTFNDYHHNPMMIFGASDGVCTNIRVNANYAHGIQSGFSAVSSHITSGMEFIEDTGYFGPDTYSWMWPHVGYTNNIANVDSTYSTNSPGNGMYAGIGNDGTIAANNTIYDPGGLQTRGFTVGGHAIGGSGGSTLSASSSVGTATGATTVSATFLTTNGNSMPYQTQCVVAGVSLNNLGTSRSLTWNPTIGSPQALTEIATSNTNKGLSVWHLILPATNNGTGNQDGTFTYTQTGSSDMVLQVFALINLPFNQCEVPGDTTITASTNSSALINMPITQHRGDTTISFISAAQSVNSVASAAGITALITSNNSSSNIKAGMGWIHYNNTTTSINEFTAPSMTYTLGASGGYDIIGLHLIADLTGHNQVQNNWNVAFVSGGGTGGSTTMSAGFAAMSAQPYGSVGYINYNVYNAPSTTNFGTQNGDTGGLSLFQTANQGGDFGNGGFDANGSSSTFSAANINTSTYVPGAGSTAINGANNLTSLCSFVFELCSDYNGSARSPSAPKWDAGAVNSVVGNIQFFSQQPTNTLSGSAFSPTVIITLTSGHNDSMTLSVVTGTCTLTGTTTVTAVSGIATFTGVGVNGTPTGPCVLKSHDNTDGTIADVTSSNFNMTGGLSFSVQPTNLISGTNFSPTVTVIVFPSAADSITLTVSGGTCNLTGTTTVTAVAGVATFTTLGANGVPQSGCILTATDNTNTFVASANSTSFNMTGTLTFSSQPTNTTTGNPFSPTITVTTNPSSTDSITISVTAGTCTIGGSTTVNAIAGLATFTGVVASAPGTVCILTAVDNTNSFVANKTSNPFNITSGVNALSFTINPITTIAGNTMPVFVVTNSNSSFTGIVTLTPSACGATFINLTAQAVAGVATFSITRAGGSGNACIFTATATGAISANSSPFNIIAATGTMEKYQNWCMQGNVQVKMGGQSSSNKAQGSFPTCTITVFQAGTQNMATLYSDNNFTPLGNPFNNQSTSTGQYFFYIPPGHYDVQIAAAGLQTYTLSYILVGQLPVVPGTLQAGALDLPDNGNPPPTAVGHVIYYTDLTGTPQICINGTPCIPLGGGGGGWTLNSPTVQLGVVTNRVLVGSNVIGDFSNASFNSTLIDVASIIATNNTTVNASTLSMGYDATAGTMDLTSGVTGTGTFLPMQMVVNGAVAMFYGTDGRVFARTRTTDYPAGAFISLGKITEVDNTANAVAVSVYALNTYAAVASEFTGSNAYKPLAFVTSGNAQAAYDINGNLLVGNNYAPIFAADNAVNDIAEFWKTLNSTLRLNVRNDSSGTTAETAITARAGTTNSTNAISMSVTGSNFTPVAGLLASQGSLVTGPSAGGGMVIGTFTGPINFEPAGTNILAAMTALSVTVNQPTGSAVFPVIINGNATSGSSFGLEINAGFTNADFPLYVRNASSTPVVYASGRGDFVVGGNGAVPPSGSPFWITASATGPQVTISSSHTNDTLLVLNTDMTGNGGGIDIETQTGNAGVIAFRVNGQIGPIAPLEVRGDNAVIMLSLTTTGSASGKHVVCVDTSTGILYASTSTTSGGCN